MEIEILRNLKENSNLGTFLNEGIPLTEIITLESLYNNSNTFPIALREMLYLCGDYCSVLDFGLTDSQQEMQEETRNDMSKYNRQISRPFFVIDVYNAGGQCLLIYLDEGTRDPLVYSAVFYERQYDSTPWLQNLGTTLSQFINFRLNLLKNGQNPF